MKVFARLLLAVSLLNLTLSPLLIADDKYRNNTNYDTGRNYSVQEFQRLQQQQRNFQPKLPDPKIYQPKLDLSFNINNILGTTWRYTAQNIGYNATKELTSLKLTIFDVSNEQTRKLVSDINIKSYGDDKNLKPAQYTEILNYASGVKLTREFANGNYEPSERWMNFKEEYAQAVQQTNRQKMTMMMNLGEPDSFLLKSFNDTIAQDDQTKLATRVKEIKYDEKDRIISIQAEIKDIAGDILKSLVKLHRDESNGALNGFTLELNGPEGINYRKEFLNQSPETIKDKLNILAKNRIPVLEDDASLIRIKDVRITNLPNLPNEDGNPESIVTVKETVDKIKAIFEETKIPEISDINGIETPDNAPVGFFNRTSELFDMPFSGLAGWGAGISEGVSGFTGKYGDKLGVVVEGNIKSNEVQAGIGYGYGVIEGIINTLGGDIPGGILQLPKFVKELAFNKFETAYAIAESIGLSITEVKAKVQNMIDNGYSNYEAGRFVGGIVGRAAVLFGGPKIIADIIGKSTTGAKIAQAGKYGSKTTLNGVVLNMAGKQKGLLTKSDLVNISRWERKLIKKGFTPELGGKAQKIILESYKEIIAKDCKFAFDLGKLDRKSRYILNEYLNGNPAIGAKARELAPKLDKMNNKEFLEFMSKEKCTARPDYLKGDRPQIMTKYEFEDGTVVKYKPLGDTRRPGPTYSIEIKKDISLPDTGFDSAALKIDSAGLPYPKHQDYIKRILPNDKMNYNLYDDFNKLQNDIIMQRVHKLLTE